MANDFDTNMKYQRQYVTDRQIDTLTGISKGVIADGVVNSDEANFLLNWLTANEAFVTKNPVTNILHERIAVMLDDGFLDDRESAELLSTLEAFTGQTPVAGELLKATTLPLDQPPPRVVVQDRRFLFTGTFAYGKRAECEAEVSERQGLIVKTVSYKLDYLVLGQYITPSWKHESFGTKIEKAMRYRDESGANISIISEDHWRDQFGLAQ